MFVVIQASIDSSKISFSATREKTLNTKKPPLQVREMVKI